MGMIRLVGWKTSFLSFQDKNKLISKLKTSSKVLNGTGLVLGFVTARLRNLLHLRNVIAFYTLYTLFFFCMVPTFFSLNAGEMCRKNCPK